MNRSVGLLRQHEMRASQQVAMQQSTQSIGRIQEYSSTPPHQSQRSAQATNMFITRILDECGLEIKMADEENMTNNDELTVSGRSMRRSGPSNLLSTCSVVVLVGIESRSRYISQTLVSTVTFFIEQ